MAETTNVTHAGYIALQFSNVPQVPGSLDCGPVFRICVRAREILRDLPSLMGSLRIILRDKQKPPVGVRDSSALTATPRGSHASISVTLPRIDPHTRISEHQASKPSDFKRVIESALTFAEHRTRATP